MKIISQRFWILHLMSQSCFPLKNIPPSVQPTDLVKIVLKAFPNFMHGSVNYFGAIGELSILDTIRYLTRSLRSILIYHKNINKQFRRKSTFIKM